MASYNKCPGGWRVRIRKNGQTHSATFPLKQQAQEWVAKVEAEIINGRLGRIPDKTFGDLLEKYQKEVTPTKRGSRPEDLRIARIRRDEIAKVKLEDLKAEDFSKWISRRAKTVSSASVLRELTTMSHACTVAVKEWKWLRENPCKNVRRPPENPPRTRLITQAEIDRILFVCGEDYTTKIGRVGLAFQFAIETAMRAGEICGLRWGDIFDSHAHLARTKNGSARDVPLSQKAKQILNLLPRDGASVFAISPAVLDALFRRVKVRAMVDGITFHDTRGLALTRMSKLVDVMMLARISGHRDLSILMRHYYRISVDEISLSLNSNHS